MLSLKQLLYRPVYDKNDVEIGKLRDILLRRNDGKGVVVTDNGVYVADKISARKGKITLDNIVETNSGEQLTEKSLYDSDGKYLGEIYDVIFGKTLKIGKITDNNGEQYSRGRIYAIGDIVIIKKQTTKQPKKANVHKQTNITANEHMRIKRTDTSKSGTYPVFRRYGDFNFLLGKTADKNITNFYGEVMLRAGDRVTHDTLRQAKISGKLIELCLHTK